jgi:multidrug efflux system membrane fusion protein
MSLTVNPQKPGVPAAGAAKRRSRTGLWMVVVAIIVAVALYFYLKKPGAEAAEAGPANRSQASRRGRGGFQPPPTVVNIAVATEGTLPDYITALGTATALNTATVRSRVDGALIKVNFEEGQAVKEGDVLAEIDPRPFEIEAQQAEGQLVRDRALLNNARLDLQRYQEAHEAVTPQQVDAAKASVAQYEGAVKSDEGALASAHLQLSFCKVIAPISGRAGLRQVDAGNLIRSSDANGIVVITQIQPIAIVFSVPEDKLPGVAAAMRKGQKLEVEIFDRSLKNKLTTGELTAIDNQIDPTTGTVKMKALAPNDDYTLFPNQFVNVRMLIEVEKDVLLLPSTAIQISGSDRYVYVLNKEDSTVERRAVKVGNSQGMFTAVVDGIAKGETVATDSLDRLQTGATVVIRDQAQVDAALKPAAPGAGARPAGQRNGEKSRRWQKNGSAPAKKSS